MGYTLLGRKDGPSGLGRVEVCLARFLGPLGPLLNAPFWGSGDSLKRRRFGVDPLDSSLCQNDAVLGLGLGVFKEPGCPIFWTTRRGGFCHPLELVVRAPHFTRSGWGMGRRRDGWAVEDLALAPLGAIGITPNSNSEQHGYVIKWSLGIL
ncbi:Uncharacterized protein TCM_039127 [Theobroma cacao]|uniref:Uncharacterized protein n=1 Tax=Theobroma cacao TaxID=3641 RepID=A0A061GR11_THECC|nr:Uncharacterized protein TCM_039127 [Theobroma cacao]